MSYSPGDTANFSISTQDSTGAASNADSTPVVSVRRNGVADVAVAGVVTLVQTGLYDVEFEIPSDYAVGDVVEVLVQVVMGGITSPLVPLWRQSLDTKNDAVFTLLQLGNPAVGARLITFTVTSDGDPVSAAAIRVTSAGETKITQTGLDGTALIAVDDGEWAYTVTKGGYDGASGTLTVNANVSEDVELEAVTLPIPSTEDRCDIYFSNDSMVRLFGGSTQVTVEAMESGVVYRPGTLATEFKGDFYANGGETPVFSVPSAASVHDLNPEASVTYKVTCKDARIAPAYFDAPDAPGSYYLADLIAAYVAP